ncbi:hypothetical protein B9Z55_005281 [Caenorhabditis nigoni]|uniref:Uncharacterized protein n=1 Tax=Caenorhabditis nigoni TaxID=1611254 RepID=A0A2G5V0L1_9PELO|nr:hypothetical protein B9Z55_005281 [Caenorhabditis nigoni]
MQPVKSTLPNSYSQVSTNARGFSRCGGNMLQKGKEQLVYYGLTQLADLVGMVGRIRHLARSVMASEGTRSFLDSSEH